MSLYNLRSTPTGYFCTKFDDDLNVVASYNVSPHICECPRGTAPTCRHRKMLPYFHTENKTDLDWFLDYDATLAQNGRAAWVTGEFDGVVVEDEDVVLEVLDEPAASAGPSEVVDTLTEAERLQAIADYNARLNTESPAEREARAEKKFEAEDQARGFRRRV